jgi:hypothetical protein
LVGGFLFGADLSGEAGDRRSPQVGEAGWSAGTRFTGQAWFVGKDGRKERG